MFRKIQVVENGSCGRNAARHGVDAVPLERGGTELLAELLPVDILGKYPLVEFVGIVAGTERTSETLLPAPLVDDFLRGKIGQELVHVVVPPLGYVELPGRKVEKSHSRGLFPEMYRCEKRIFLVDEYVVAQHHAGVTSSMTPRFTIPLTSLGSSSCSHTATRSPARTSFGR